jgi:hypothetical protein
MTVRTTRKNVTFSKPFVLRAVDHILPPGTYMIETDEELIGNQSTAGYRRLATMIHVRDASRTQVFQIDPTELDADMMRDAELTVLRSTDD